MLRLEAVAEGGLSVATRPPGAFVEEIVLGPTPGVLRGVAGQDPPRLL
jgi:hypothetical protein